MEDRNLSSYEPIGYNDWKIMNPVLWIFFGACAFVALCGYAVTCLGAVSANNRYAFIAIGSALRLLGWAGVIMTLVELFK